MTINQLIFSTPLEEVANRIAGIGALSTYFQQVIKSLHNSTLDESIVNNTIAFIIDRNADVLEENTWNNTLIEDLINTPHWNETLVAALQDYKTFYIDKDLSAVLSPWDQADLRNADAGASFTIDTHYVVPWINIDSEDYQTVRTTSDILITGVIDNSRFLQFTKSQDKPWIRLIMPMNPRRVEIEDLDRNFWVIGQGISIICAYLFDDKSPLKTMFNHILREITEQWENMLYLWLNYEIMSSRSSYITLIEDLPNSKLFVGRKFDGFDNEEWKEISSQSVERDMNILNSSFYYLTQKYSDSRISLLVRARYLNYYQNWYKSEVYPYYGYYNGEKWTWFRLYKEDNKNNYFKFSPGADDYDNILYGYKQEDDMYKYGQYGEDYPLAAIRIEPEILSGGLNPVISFVVTDAIGTMVKKNLSTIKAYHTELDGTLLKVIRHDAAVTPTPTSGTISIDNIDTPVYLGEVPSKYYNFGVISGEG